MKAYLKKPAPASEEEKRQELVQQAMEERRKRLRNKSPPSKTPNAKTLRPQAQENASKDHPEPMEEDASSLADSSGERAERVETEATFSPDEEEDDHAAKDIEVSMGRTSITTAMPMTGEAPQVEGSIAATPAPKEMRPSPRRIHFAEEVVSTTTTPAATRTEVNYLVLAPDPWLGPPPETPLNSGDVTDAVTNAITDKIGLLGSEIMMGKAATPYRRLGANHFFIMMDTFLTALEVAEQLSDGIEIPHGKGTVKMLIAHEQDSIAEEEPPPKASQAIGAKLWVYADTPRAMALLDEPAVSEGLKRLGLSVLEEPYVPDEKTKGQSLSDHKTNKYIVKVIPTIHVDSDPPPSLEEMVQDFKWPFEIPVLLRGEEPYSARYSIQGRFSTPPIEIKGLYPCCHAKRGEPHRCTPPAGAGKAGSKRKAVTLAKADPTTSECRLYTYGLCYKQDDCERYHSPPAGTRIPCALPQADSDTLVRLGLSQNTVTCRKGPKCVFDHSGWTPATHSETTAELKKKKKHMAKSQKTNSRQKNTHTHTHHGY